MPALSIESSIGMFLQRDIMDELIVGALSECRIESEYRAFASAGHASRQSGGVLLANANIVSSGRKAIGESLETTA